MVSQNYFRLKAGAAPCTVMHLLQIDVTGIGQQLAKTIKQAPDFFSGVPVILDFEKIDLDASINFTLLKDILLANGLIPVGVKNLSKNHRENSVNCGLPILEAGKVRPFAEKANKPQNSGFLSRLVTKQVRSGVQLYAENADLVVTAPVSPGAELFADGNIHVYGPLRGRALAGMQGNIHARIFCTSLEAELISIAGFYMTRDDMQALLPKNHAMIQVYLDKEQVKIASL